MCPNYAFEPPDWPRLWRAAGALREFSAAARSDCRFAAAQRESYALTLMQSRFSTVLSIFVAAVHLCPPTIVAQEPVAALEERPVALPVIEPGDSCPTSVGHRGTVPIQRHIFGGALWFGEGPVYFALAWKDSPGDDATFALEPVPREGNAHRAKTPWVSVPSYSGPIFIRGRALDASGRTLRFDATGSGPQSRLELAAPHAPEPSLWSFWPSSMWVPGRGCYGVQIDTLDATDIVIFEAL